MLELKETLFILTRSGLSFTKVKNRFFLPQTQLNFEVLIIYLKHAQKIKLY
jgi:hypothetical protein